MTNMMKKLSALLLVALLLCSCESRTPRVEYDGKLLSEEDIAALGKPFETEAEKETETETETDEPADGIVHWTDGGTVWHERLSCSRLSDKSPVRTGSVDEALAAKKERGCSFCCE